MDWVVEGGKGSHEMTKARSPNQISRNHAKPTMGTRGTTGRGASFANRVGQVPPAVINRWPTLK